MTLGNLQSVKSYQSYSTPRGTMSEGTSKFGESLELYQSMEHSIENLIPFYDNIYLQLNFQLIC